MSDKAANDDAKPAARDALALVGAVVGGAAWVGVVGGVVLAVRFADIGVPPGPAVALLPTEHQVVVGLRFLAIPLLLALVAYLYLLYRRQDDDSAESENAPGTLPKGWIEILIIAGGGGIAVACISETAGWARGLILVLTLAGGLVLWAALKTAQGFAAAGYILFLVVAISAGLMTITFEWGDTRLDLAAGVRKDGRPLSGYYLAKSDSAAYLVIPVFERISSAPVEDQATGLPETASRCESSDAGEILRGGSEPCYYNEIQWGSC